MATKILQRPYRAYAVSDARLGISRFGLKAESVSERLTELFEMAPPHLAKWGFDPRPLELFRARLVEGRTPADEMIEAYISSGRQLHHPTAPLRSDCKLILFNTTDDRRHLSNF